MAALFQVQVMIEKVGVVGGVTGTGMPSSAVMAGLTAGHAAWDPFIRVGVTAASDGSVVLAVFRVLTQFALFSSFASFASFAMIVVFVRFVALAGGAMVGRFGIQRQ